MNPIKTLRDLKITFINSPEDIQVAARHEITKRTTEENDDAFATFNLSQLIRRLEAWNSCLPGVEPHYAVKANPDDGVVLTMAKLGVGFDCSSQDELEQVLGYGVAPSKIVFAHTVKQPSHLRYAAKMGVQLTTYDSDEEMLKIREIDPDQKLLLRISVKNPYAKYPAKLDKKFGCPVDYNTVWAEALLTGAKRLGLDVVGISFHIGIHSSNAEPYEKAIAAAKTLFNFGNSIGHTMDLLDIGGGFPGVEDLSSFKEFSAQVSQALKTHFPEHGQGIRIISEPGQFFAQSPVTLYTCINAVKQVPASFITETDEDGIGFMYYLNHGVYGYFNQCRNQQRMIEPDNIIHKSASDSINSNCTRDSSEHISLLWGPTCDSLDVIHSGCKLPKLELGDWLEFKEIGDYTTSTSCDFNGFPHADVLYFLEEQHRHLLDSR